MKLPCWRFTLPPYLVQAQNSGTCYTMPSLGERPDFARGDRASRIGAPHRREAHRQRIEIVTGIVQRLAVFFDRREQLAHRSLKALGEPRAAQLGRKPTVGGIESHLLIGKRWSKAARRRARADNRGP